MCTECQLNEATIHLIQFRVGSAKELHLCASCAAQRGLYSGPSQGPSWKTATPSAEKKQFTPLLLPGQKRPLLTQEAPPPAIVPPSAEQMPNLCPNCGMDLAELRQQRTAGCAYCYEYFAEELHSWLEPIRPLWHSPKAKGSVKGGASLSQVLQGERSRQRHEAYLRELLHRHLALERYEKAAIIRDQLRQLRGDGETLSWSATL